jgi:hypothetical protein
MRRDASQARTSRPAFVSPVFPDPPESIEDLQLIARYQDPNYDGPILDRPPDMLHSQQVLEYGQMVPHEAFDCSLGSPAEIEQLFSGAVEQSTSSTAETQWQEAELRRSTRVRSQREAQTAVARAENARAALGAARLLSSSGSSSRSSRTEQDLRVRLGQARSASQPAIANVSAQAGGFEGLRGHKRSQSNPAIGTLVTSGVGGLQGSRGLKRSTSEKGARASMRAIPEQGEEQLWGGRKRRLSEPFGDCEGFGPSESAWGNEFHSFGVGGESSPPWLGTQFAGLQTAAVVPQQEGRGIRRPMQNYRQVVSWEAGAAEAATFAPFPSPEDVLERTERGARARNPGTGGSSAPPRAEEAELGLVAALELGRHLTNTEKAGTVSRTRPRSKNGGTASKGSGEAGEEKGFDEKKEGKGLEEEQGPRRRRRSGKAWWQAAFAARLQEGDKGR